MIGSTSRSVRVVTGHGVRILHIVALPTHQSAFSFSRYVSGFFDLSVELDNDANDTHDAQ